MGIRYLVLHLSCEIHSTGVWPPCSVSVRIEVEFGCVNLWGHLIFSVVTDTDGSYQRELYNRCEALTIMLKNRRATEAN